VDSIATLLDPGPSASRPRGPTTTPAAGLIKHDSRSMPRLPKKPPEKSGNNPVRGSEKAARILPKPSLLRPEFPIILFRRSDNPCRSR